jgi:hypothetical protein
MSPGRRIATREAATRRSRAGETVSSTTRRAPHGMEAAAAHAAPGVKAATTADAADMHAAATTAESSATMEAATAATVKTTATTATAGASRLDRNCQWKACDRDYESGGERQRYPVAGESRHVFLHLQGNGGRETGSATICFRNN